MPRATLLIGSKNYSSWSLRGFLLARLSGLRFEERQVAPDDPVAREELLMRTASIRIPMLTHEGVEIWDTLAIAEYLNETFPEAGLLPAERRARALCRSICGEMHSGFYALRNSLPMNLRASHPNFSVWSGARADIERIVEIWHQCLDTWGGPFLFGERRTMADAMFAPVVTRFLTYDVRLDRRCARYGDRIMEWPDMAEWVEAAQVEPEMLLPELDEENWPA